MSQQFGEDSDLDSDGFDPSSTALPFPKPLDRASFLVTTFSAPDFLESLTSRFQTLEDLQTELQDLLRSLNKELVDLVNDNYRDFLSLGEKLKGGEERIEEVRVGLLGFHRDVTSVRDLVSNRSGQIKALLDEKRDLKKEIRAGRTLLEIDERLDELETRLGISKAATDYREDTTHVAEDEVGQDKGFDDWPEEWLKEENSSFGDDETEDADQPVPGRLSNNVTKLQAIQLLMRRCGEQHPFILSQRDRVAHVKEFLGRDLELAIRKQTDVRAKQQIIQLRVQLDGD